MKTEIYNDDIVSHFRATMEKAANWDMKKPSCVTVSRGAFKAMAEEILYCWKRIDKLEAERK